MNDTFNDDPDLLRLSRSARLLHVEGMVFCNRLLTDGEILPTVLARFTDSADVESDVAELVAAGLWQVAANGGWQLDWTHQETKATVELRRAAQALKQKRYRLHSLGDDSMCNPKYCPRRKLHDRDDHSGCVASWCKAAALRDNDGSNETGGVTSPRPDPSRRDKGRKCNHAVAADGTCTNGACTVHVIGVIVQGTSDSSAERRAS